MARILLAEDDEAMRQFLSTALTRVGHDVDSFSDGRKALSALDVAYDLVIADIVMPGVDGLELARRARDRDPLTRVMFITGFAAVALGDSGPPIPDVSVLSKPFQLRNLVTEVDRILRA